MLFAVFFAVWRVLEIITLIPTMGMLAWFVDIYVKANSLTPNHILILFIVSVLALAWAMFTLFSYHRSSTNSQFVGIIDLAFVGTFIAAIYYLKFVPNTDCVTWNWGSFQASGAGFFISGPSVNVNSDKPCAMLKACFAFAIMNAVMFFFTSVLAWMHGGRMSSAEADRRTTHHHSHRHSHRRHSHSGSHRSRRSSHSHQRVYV